MVKISIEVNGKEKKIEIPSGVSELEATKKMYEAVKLWATFIVVRTGNTVLCFPKQIEDVQKIEETLKKVQEKGFSD